MNKKILTIAVGTTYSQKIECLSSILNKISIEANVIPVKVESGVSEQPLSEIETLTGSINRAQEALKKTPTANFGLGIEVGYYANKRGKYEIFCYASIVDPKGIIESAISSRFLLPEFHQRILKEGKYLGEYVRKYKEKSQDPLTTYIREMIRSRKNFITEAIHNVLLAYLESISPFSS